MTSQTKYYIELSDILAVRCECKRCGATVSLPIVEDVRTNRLYGCPNCNEPWTVFQQGQAGQSIDPSLRAFLNTLSSFKDVLQRTQQLLGDGGFVFSLEVRKEVEEF
jgi:hypothetical protein